MYLAWWSSRAGRAAAGAWYRLRVALAAVLDGRIPVRGKTVVIVATGGNVALGRFTALVGSE